MLQYQNRTGIVAVEDYAYDIICIIVDEPTKSTQAAIDLWVEFNPSAVVPELTELERYRVASLAVELHEVANELQEKQDEWERIFTATQEEIDIYNKFKDVFGEVETY